MRRQAYRKIYTWNPSIAYVAGLIASDGCLSKDGLHLNLTSNDLEILNTVIQILDLKVKIGQKRNGYGGLGTQIQFGDVALYDFLLEAGITPAKSKTIQKVDVPDMYYGDFLRGVFDGDGTVYGFWDPRWRSSLMYYTGFVSASRNFLEWLRRTNTRLVDTTAGQIKVATRADILTYAKADSQKIFECMYYSHNLPALSRKRMKFVDFIRSDPYASEELLGRVAER